MKRIKFTTLVIALVLTAGVFSGCSGSTETAPSYVDVEDLNSGSLPEIPPIYFGENSSRSNTETKPSDSMGDNSNSTSDTQSAKTDSETSTENSSNTTSTPQNDDKYAEIIIPTAGEYNVCTAEFSVFDPEKVKTALLGNVELTPEIRHFSNSEYPEYIWNNDNISLDVDNRYQTVKLSGDLSSLIRYIIVLPTHNSNGNIDEFERRNDDLDFCTREQAVKSVKNTLSKMDVAVSDNANVYSFHQGDLQNYINKRIEEQRFYDPKTSVKDTTAKPLTSYTVDKSQECYYIVFNEEHDGIPIYNQYFGYRTITDLTIQHPEIIAIYSSDGLVGLEIYRYRGKISNGEKITQVITSESAAQVVAEKYADVVGIQQVDFDKLELMYVITPGIVDGKINVLKAKMIPAWVCTINYTQWSMDKMTGGYADISYKSTILIDAQTGAEII